MKLTPFLLPSLLLLAVIQYSSAFVGFDCSQPVPKSLYRLTSDPDCSKKASFRTKNQQVEGALVQMPQYVTVKVKILEILNKIEVPYCTYYNLRTKRIKGSEYRGFTPAKFTLATLSAWKDARKVQFSYSSVTLQLGATKTVVDSNEITKEGFCKGYSKFIKYPIYQVRYYAAEGQVILDRKGRPSHILVDGERVSGDIGDHQGLLSDGSAVFWHHVEYSKCRLELIHGGNLTQIQTTQGQVTVLIPEISVGLVLEQQTNICSLDMWRTNDERLFVIQGRAPVLPPLTAKSWGSWSILIKAAVQFSLSTTAAKFMDLSSQITLNQCILEQMIQREVIYGASSSPEFVGYRLTGTRGSALAVAGGLIQHLECTGVEVLFDQKDSCFNKIPIIDTRNNQSKFMDPVTHVMSNTASKMQCSDPQVPYFEIRGVWYRMIPHRTQIPNPPSLPSNLQSLSNVTLPIMSGMYPEEMIDNMNTNWMHRPSREKALNQLISLASDSIGDDSFEPSQPFQQLIETTATSTWYNHSLALISWVILLTLWIGSLTIVQVWSFCLKQESLHSSPVVVNQIDAGESKRTPLSTRELQKLLEISAMN